MFSTFFFNNQTLLFFCSVSHHQTGPLYAGHNAPDVQDPSLERAHFCLLSIGLVHRWRQEQRHPAYVARFADGSMFPLHYPLETPQGPVQASATAEHLQSVLGDNDPRPVCRSLHGTGLSRARGQLAIAT